MKLKDLTIIIPSIGRKSVIDAINSVHPECPVIIAFDYEFKLWDFKSMLIRPIDDYYQVNFKSAGLTKQFLIDKVTTDYFCILDDDDQFVSGYFSLVEFYLKRHTNVYWMATHYTSNIPYRKPMLYDVYTITPESFRESYFKWTRNKQEYENNKLRWVYPCSEVIVKTKEFREMQSNDYRLRLTRSNWDEVVAFTYFMSTHVGLNHEDYGIIYGVPDDSISHNSKEYPTTNGNLIEAVKDMTEMYIETDNPIWIQAITNAVEAANYNYKHY